MSSLIYRHPRSPFWYVSKTRTSTKTTNKRDAIEFAKKAMTDAWRHDALGEQSHTWADLCASWLDLKGDQKRTISKDRVICAGAEKYLGGKELSEVTAEDVRAYGKAVKDRASASTANRHLNVIRAMLRLAASYGWIIRVPKVEMYTLPKTPGIWITLEQLELICAHLPALVADMARFAIHTGLRYSNVAGLRWDWISSDGSVCVVPAASTKTGRVYTIPLNSVAKKIVAGRREATKQSKSEYVFYRADGETPMPTVRYWWEAATKKAGLPDVRFHDLRHSFATMHHMNGTPDRALQELGGWSSPAMLQRYVTLSTTHLSKYIENVNKPTPGNSDGKQ